MRWIKRGLWLSAWGVWAWLGVGLYHQLPREPGPATCTLPLNSNDVGNLGFLGQSNRFAVLHDMETQRARLSIYNATDGSLDKETLWPSYTLLSGTVPRSTDEGSLIFGSNIDPDSDVAGLSVFDLDTFEWKRLSTTPNRLFSVAVDARRKIGICSDHGVKPSRIVFLDLTTGTELNGHEVPKEWSFTGGAFVDPSRGLAAISMTKPKVFTTAESAVAQKMEIWTLDRPPTMIGSVSFSRKELASSASLNGRIAFTRIGTQAPFRVFDMARQEWIFEKDAPNEPTYDPKKRGVANEPRISPSGRSVLDGKWSSLWDIESNTLLWSKQEEERVWVDRLGTMFLVQEDWFRPLRKWRPGLGFETWALRDLESGALIVRTSEKGFSTPPKMNNARSLVVLKDGTVHRLPLSVNWGLWTICQAILAVPLLMVWGVLRWTKRRRMRRAQSVPTVA